MSSLFESLSKIVDRVELVAKGVDGERRTAEAALRQGKLLDARESARRIVARVPDSAVALAIWAEAAEGCWLYEEAHEALTRLSQMFPWNGDIWLKLGRTALRIGDPRAREYLLRASETEDRDAVDDALLALADLDWVKGDPQRALHWLLRVNIVRQERNADVFLRRAECEAELGHVREARAALDSLAPSQELLPRRLAAELKVSLLECPATDDPEVTVRRTTLAQRVAILEAPRAEDLFFDVVLATRDPGQLSRLREVAEAAAMLDHERVAVAFALASGRPEEARAALAAWVSRDTSSRASEALLSVAARLRDVDLLRQITSEVGGARELVQACDKLAAGNAGGALGDLDAIGMCAENLWTWVGDVRVTALGAWLGEEPNFEALLAFAHREAAALGILDAVARLAALQTDLSAPIRVAVVGEFNAGKSTFINALVGADVAPTGVLPTTATLHWLRFAPDAFARIVLVGEQDRVVPHHELKATLERVSAHSRVSQVYIYAPLERLRLVEVIDTPGFNAPNPEHARAAERAFDEAHVVVWLLDATAPFKASERMVLAAIRERKIPTVVVVNKSDRVPKGELGAVLSHVEVSLRQEQIPHLGRPVALSARQALKGKLGDAEALEESNWQNMERMLSDDVDGQRGRWRRLGVVRSLLAVLASLELEVGRREAMMRVDSDHARERALARFAAANTLVQRRDELKSKLFERLKPVLDVLLDDLRPLVNLERGKAESVSVRRYRMSRFADRLCEPLALELGQLLSIPIEEAAHTWLRATLRGIAAVDTSTDPITERDFEFLFDSIAASLEEWLRRQESAPALQDLRARTQRLAALRSALERALREGSDHLS